MKRIKLFEQFMHEETSLESIKQLKEIKEEEYERMLEVLPPIYLTTVDGVRVKEGFAVAEPSSERNHQPTFGVYFKMAGKFYSTLALLYKTSGTPITFATYHDREFTKDNKATSVEKNERGY